MIYKSINWFLYDWNIGLKLFLASVLFLYRLKTPENQMFLGDIKWEHWPEISYIG